MERVAWIVAGALVIGTLDAAYAIVFWGMRGVGPIQIFQSIASGLLGRTAFSGGLEVLVYLFMNYVVIPLSATSRSRFLLSWVVCSVIVHAFLIGVPTAFFARKAS